MTLKHPSFSFLAIVVVATLLINPKEGHTNSFVHLFEWPWEDIAKECEEFLGPNGYTAVQISPPNEHRLLLGRPWYERYQPISYKLHSRSGTRNELIAMVKRCHDAGVRVYADVIINHMASCRPQCDQLQPQFGNKGVGNNSYVPGVQTFQDLFDPQDKNRVLGALTSYGAAQFHQACLCFAPGCSSVTNCALEQLADLATERADVQATIANYLASLVAIDIDGFRIDAAKHIEAKDLHSILQKAATAANGQKFHIEDTDIGPIGSKSILVFQEFIGDPPDKNTSYSNGKVTEFNFGEKESRAFLNWGGPKVSKAGQLIKDMQDSLRVVIFIDNHDKQRGHGGGGGVWANKGGDGKNYGIRNDLQAYVLANVFMLAFPYGYPQVMSSYRFGNGELWNDPNPDQDITSIQGITVTDDFIGPPHSGMHKKILTQADYADAENWHTRHIWVNNGLGGVRNSCFDPTSKWMCEHRWSAIAGMVRFRAATAAQFATDHPWDDGQNRLAFGRGDKGFVVINGERSSDATVFGPEENGWFQTGLAPGKYCDVIKSHLSPEKTKCVLDNGSEVAPISVFDDGKAQFVVAAMDAVAIHVAEKIQP